MIQRTIQKYSQFILFVVVLTWQNIPEEKKGSNLSVLTDKVKHKLGFLLIYSFLFSYPSLMTYEKIGRLCSGHYY